jgi:hypothetical protein
MLVVQQLMNLCYEYSYISSVQLSFCVKNYKHGDSGDFLGSVTIHISINCVIIPLQLRLDSKGKRAS